jgi:8-oxo-dGTP pyrophosphatase MutT (NUDIX family)
MSHRVETIPFIVEDGDVKLFMVRSFTRRRWVFPIGTLKKGEGKLKGCRREAFEEAGIKGKVLSDLPITAIIKSKDKSKSDMMVVTYFPVFVTKQTKEWPEKKLRNRQWVSLDEINHHLKKGDLRKVVRIFRVLLPFIRAGAVKSKWTKGW